MRLNELKDRPGANKSRMRVGRGIGSGKGKTAGRGVKGQKARTGVAIKGFEGGQNPIHMRLPKRGFNSPFKPDYVEINLARVQEAVDAGKLDLSATIDGAALKAAGVIRREKDGVRLLGEGELKAKINFELAGASASARKAVEAAGGTLSIKMSTRAARKLAKREARASETAAAE